MGSSARVTIESVVAEAPKTPKRRRYSIAEKRRIVEESFQPRSSVARVGGHTESTRIRFSVGGACTSGVASVETCARHQPRNCCP